MAKDSLERFVEKVEASWGPLSTELIAVVRDEMEKLVKTPTSEKWMGDIINDEPEDRDLWRNPKDPKYGRMLLVHTEATGRYRPPHDHGASWVIYGMVRGEVDMGTWIRVQEPDGKFNLVKRELNRLRPGQVKVFLPGDIHDTRTLVGPATILRFTERDLIREERETRRLTRYIQQDGVWVERKPQPVAH
jgi:hypothetical protein